MLHPLPPLPTATRDLAPSPLPIHPKAHSLVATHMIQGMTAEFFGRGYKRLRLPYPHFLAQCNLPALQDSCTHRACYVCLGCSSGEACCLTTLSFPQFDKPPTTETKLSLSLYFVFFLCTFLEHCTYPQSPIRHTAFWLA